jgi:DNA-binding NarL/FixJ family response regulator
MSSEIARQVVAAFQAPAPAGQPGEDLSRREQEILDQLLRGFANKEIADHLSISVFTVKNHLRSIYEKLHVRSRTDVLLKYRDTPSEPDAKRGLRVP